MLETAVPAFVGYGLAWGDVAERAGFTEEFAPGAFRRALTGRPHVRCLFGGQELANLRDGSLSIVENAAGLRLELQPWEDSAVLAGLRARSGAIAGVALYARVIEATWSPAPRRHRTVLEAQLLAVAIILTSHRRAPAFRSSWLVLKTPATAWRADLAELDARGRELDEDLEDLEEVTW